MNKKYNYDLKNIKDWRKEFNREIIDKTVEYQNKYNFDIGTGKHATWNNEADAFKHAFMQAKMVYKSGGIELPATILGNYHEFIEGNKIQSEGEKNMDLWNNYIGRQVATEVLKELKSEHLGEIKNQKEFEDRVAEKIYQKMQNGELITNPNDTRRYEDLIKGNPTGGASPIEERPFSRQEIARMTPEEFQANESIIMEQLEKGRILDEKVDYDIQFPHGCYYTREDIAKMSSKEYRKHEKDILKQMKKQGIPSEKYLPKGEKSRYSKSQSSGGLSGTNSGSEASDGHWVTINGNHVLIDD